MKNINLFLTFSIVTSLMFACSDYIGEIDDNHNEYQEHIASLESSDSQDDSVESSSSVSNEEENSSSASTAKSSSSVTAKTIKCGDLWCGPLDAEGKVEIPGQTGEYSGYWFDYNDNADPLNGNSRLVFPEDVETSVDGNFYGPLTEAYGGIKAYSQISSKNDSSFAGIQFNIVDNVGTGGDITDWDGICVTYYSNVDFNILLAEENEWAVTEYNNYKVSVPKSETVAVADIPWDKFKQELGWGKKVYQASILKKVATVRFKFNQNGDFAILSVGRAESCTIDAPYPPEKTFKSLADIKI